MSVRHSSSVIAILDEADLIAEADIPTQMFQKVWYESFELVVTGDCISSAHQKRIRLKAAPEQPAC